MNLTPHFTLEELTISQEAIRKGLFNVPSMAELANLRRLADSLELVRLVTRKPIHVNSGYRSRAVNEAVGGSKNSDHMDGRAADIICPAFGTPLELCNAIHEHGIDFDQIIHEFGAWCHFAIAPSSRAPRKELLTIASAKMGYQKGLLPV